VLTLSPSLFWLRTYSSISISKALFLANFLRRFLPSLFSKFDRKKKGKNEAMYNEVSESVNELRDWQPKAKDHLSPKRTKQFARRTIEYWTHLGVFFFILQPSPQRRGLKAVT
jgi:hypothetical protein